MSLGASREPPTCKGNRNAASARNSVSNLPAPHKTAHKNEKTQVYPGFSLVVRAGLEPATHGFSVRQRTNEIVDQNQVHANRVQNRVQADLLPNNKAAKKDLLSNAQRSIQASRSAIAKLIDATPLDDHYRLEMLVPILAELRAAESILGDLEGPYTA